MLFHVSEILLNVRKHRLKKKIENQIGEDQFRFRYERGTREAILALHQIFNGRIDVNRNAYANFIDENKVNGRCLFKTLNDNGIEWRDGRLILKLYKIQTIIDINRTKQSKIRKGVRQGCPLAPYLFNIFIEASINEFKIKRRIKINGQRVHSILFADDIVMLAESQNMNKMFNTLADIIVKKLNLNRNQLAADIKKIITLAKQAFLKKYNKLNLLIGRIMGRRPKGTSRTNYFHDIKEKMGGVSYQQLKEAAKDRHMANSTRCCL
ncbi:Reverse transcriptase domain [Cinara cedri]|uniref:Reverse transcriptase domain n=1 Tax=Cinara cedri TaxID=506608 RepID=A0A5E4MFA0_9HEMI|nr:Reverse transcriptase domain [Cinara cedri]